MKKISFILALVISVMMLMPGLAFAAGKPVESKADQFYINGKLGKYSLPPITVDGEKLLPYKDLLLNLGVKNDAKHIQWNAAKKTLTIVQEPATLVLTVGSTAAKVNGKAAKLKIAPVMYKNTPYIPVRFIAENLGKKIAFVDASNAIYIKDAKAVGDTKALLEKASAAMNALEKYKSADTAKLNLDASLIGMKITADINTATQTDNKNKIKYTRIEYSQAANGGAAQGGAIETVVNNSILFTNSNAAAKDSHFIKKALTDADVNRVFSFVHVNADDTASMVYTASAGKAADEIVLKGNVNIASMLDSIRQLLTGVNNINVTSAYSEITMNKTTNLVTGISLKVSGSTPDVPGGASFTLDLSESYTDMNGNFEITLPDETK